MIVNRLRADAGLIALGEPPLSADTQFQRIFGKRQPATLVWPFCSVRVADEGPLRQGTTVRVTVHTFSKAQFDDEAEQLNAAVTAALDDAVLVLSPARTARLVWIRSQVISDAAEADANHGLNSFDAAIG